MTSTPRLNGMAQAAQTQATLMEGTYKRERSLCLHLWHEASSMQCLTEKCRARCKRGQRSKQPFLLLQPNGSVLQVHNSAHATEHNLDVV